MTSQTCFRLATAALFIGSISIPIRAEDPPATAKPKGDLWEITSQMTMEGMPMAMPPQKSKVCASKTWTEPPAPENQQQKCTNSDFQVDPPNATWKVTCEPPHAMTGTGEITRDGDADYAGTIKFVSADGNLTLKITGHRTGECANPR